MGKAQGPRETSGGAQSPVKKSNRRGVTNRELTRSRYRGCLYGLAVGDALGAPVEFLSLEDIQRRYGKRGIRDFDSWGRFPAGGYTDDTQMSLATALGCIRALQRTRSIGMCHPASVVYQRYLDWLKSQDDAAQRRAPGNTCLSALRSGTMGTIEERINDSKGCGGVMRTAPAGLAFPSGEAFREGAEYAAITHGHPTGHLTAGYLAELVALLVSGKSLDQALDGATTRLDSYSERNETLEAVNLARRLAATEVSPERAISQIGEGWIAEEALAISIYCSLKFRDNFKEAVIAAVNHSGDSDSTGSITGAILGTALGLKAIPAEWVRRVEASEQIGKLADDMFAAFVEAKPLSTEEYPPN